MPLDCIKSKSAKSSLEKKISNFMHKLIFIKSLNWVKFNCLFKISFMIEKFIYVSDIF